MIDIRPAIPEDGRCQSCLDRATHVIEAEREAGGRVITQLRLCDDCTAALKIRCMSLTVRMR